MRGRLLLGSLLLGACAPVPPDGVTSGRVSESIVGGEPAAAAAFRNVAWLDDTCTAALVHPELLLTASHCVPRATKAWFDTPYVYESDGPEPVSPGREVALERCESAPGASPDAGSDLAWCLLAEPLLDRPVVPPARGCERASVGAETVATLIGFGEDDAGASGTLRTTEALVVETENELVIGQPGQGTCAGDSGGPALIRAASAAGSEWRLLGILSSGSSDGCGLGYYADVSRFIGWIRETSQREVTPCFEGDVWQPGSACLAPALDEAGLEGEAPYPSSTCGPAFEPATTDTVPPSLAVSVERVGTDGRWLDVHLDVGDEGSGVRRVELELVDAAGGRVRHRADEIAPFEFAAVELGNASELRVTAVDHAALITRESLSIAEDGDRTGTGCSVVGTRAPARNAAAFVVLTALILAWRSPLTSRRRARIRPRHERAGHGTRGGGLDGGSGGCRRFAGTKRSRPATRRRRCATRVKARPTPRRRRRSSWTAKASAGSAAARRASRKGQRRPRWRSRGRPQSSGACLPSTSSSSSSGPSS